MEATIYSLLSLQVYKRPIFYTRSSDSFQLSLGTAVSWDGNFNDHTEDEVFASVIDLLLNCACFVYIGAWLPFNAFSIPNLDIISCRLAVLTFGILFLRRIPAILILYGWIPEITSWREALFFGHFGTYVHHFPVD